MTIPVPSTDPQSSTQTVLPAPWSNPQGLEPLLLSPTDGPDLTREDLKAILDLNDSVIWVDKLLNDKVTLIFDRSICYVHDCTNKFCLKCIHGMYLSSSLCRQTIL